MQPASVYVHIPFCISKCRYCDFNSIALKEPVEHRYIEALLREISKASANAPAIQTVYLGGGTPTILHEELIKRIMDHLFQSFKIHPDAEITIEANPGTLNHKKLAAIRSTGINRISIGAQSFDEKELLFMGRLHKTADIEASVSSARQAGFRNLSLDLIYGLPGQSLDQWQNSLAKAASLGPEHISTYELTIENGTPLSDDIIMGRFRVPDEDLVSDMYYLAIEKLTDAGYHQYEISNFAKKGFECKHNINYWNRGWYLGFGAGAHSFWNCLRRSNIRDISDYCDCIETSSDTTDEHTVIDNDEAVRETIFLGLRKLDGIDLSELPADVRLKIEKAASELVRSSLVSIENNRLKLTRKGLILSSEVIVRVLSGIESPCLS